MNKKTINYLQNGLLSLLLMMLSTTGLAKDFVVGTVSFFPPFILSSSNNVFTGFDPTLMYKICKKLQLECKFKVYDFSQLENALAEDKIDAAISGISITFNRRQRMYFTIPYLPSNARFIAHKRIKDSVTNSDDLFAYRKELLRMRIGVRLGGTYERRLKDMLPGYKRLISYKDINSAMSDLIDNHIDLILTDELAAYFWQQRAPQQLFLFGKSLPIGEGYGIIVAPKNKGMVDRINREILSMQINGDFLELYERFFARLGSNN